MYKAIHYDWSYEWRQNLPTIVKTVSLRFAPPEQQIASLYYIGHLILDIYLLLVEYGSESMSVSSHFDSTTL